MRVRIANLNKHRKAEKKREARAVRRQVES